MNIKFLTPSLCFLASIGLNACNTTNEQRYEGYVDANLTYLSSDYPGRLSHLSVNRGSEVQLAQRLFTLEQSKEQYEINNSLQSTNTLQAQLRELQNQLKYAKTTLERYLALNKEGFATNDMVDEKQKNLAVIMEKINAIQSEIKAQKIVTQQKEWQHSRKENTAPESGIIFDTYYNNGEYVGAGKPVLSLITQSNIKIIFYAPSSELNQLHLNQSIEFKPDGFQYFFQGKISYIAAKAEYTLPQVYTPTQRNKLVYRIEATLIQDDLNKLHLGQPVSIKVNGNV